MSLFAELKRRNVIRVAAAYLVASWLLIEATSVLIDIYEAPLWVPKVLVGLLALGFPLSLFFSWAFEITPEGVKREAEVDRSASTTHHTAKRLDIITIVLLVAAVGLFLSEGLWRDAPPLATAPSAGNATAAAEHGLVSVAVLPFANMSADAENEYFADGISEEILNLLAGVRDLSVASRTSAFGFKGKDTPIPEIAAALDVRYVLEGSVRKSGEQVRITAQLIDASNDRHLWSETYDRTLDDIFAIQDEIAAAIGAALQIELLGSGGQRVAAESIDPEVFARFLEARYLMRRRNLDDLIRAVGMLEAVVQAEPGFARAHVVLGEGYLLYGRPDGSSPHTPEQATALALEHAEIARALDPNLGGIYLILGNVGQGQNRQLEALRHYDHAIQLEPQEPRPYHWRGMRYGFAGYLEQSRADLERAVQLEPDNANANGWLAGVVAAQGDMEAAIRLAARQRDLGNRTSGLLHEGLFDLLAGDPAAADAAFQGIDNDEIRATLQLLMAIARGEAELDTLLDTPFLDGEPGGYSHMFMLLALDEGEAFLRILEAQRSLAESHPGVIWADRFATLRADPRFVTYMAAQGYTEMWRELGPPLDCRAEGESFRCGYGANP